MARVLLQNVTKIYNDKIKAVDNVTLEVNDQEFMVVVGPSGCGKTTILRMVAGLEDVTDGKIYIGEAAANNIKPKDRDVSMVFQNYALYPHMTVFRNMAFGLKLLKYPKSEIEKRVLEAAKLLEIENLLDRMPQALSGGQRQRVAVGRAIVRNPKVFLFDEPLSNLDTILRITTRTELKLLHKRLKTTTIYVTHDQSEAMTMGDRICVLSKGVIQQIGSPLEVYNRPANRFVASFFGASPMNLLNGRIQMKDSRSHFTILGGELLLPSRLQTIAASYRDKEMVLGIRPESLSLTPTGSINNNSVRIKVVAIEPLGDSMDICMTLANSSRIVANIESNIGINAEEYVTAYIDMEKVHIFEKGNGGRNILFS